MKEEEERTMNRRRGLKKGLWKKERKQGVDGEGEEKYWRTEDYSH